MAFEIRYYNANS